MRVLVTGSRDWIDRLAVHAFLAGLQVKAQRDGTPFVIIQGGAKGADAMAAAYRLGNAQHEPYPVKDWSVCEGAKCTPSHRRKRRDGTEFCPTAGHYRNQQMLTEGRPDLVVAFKNGFDWTLEKGGTEDMVRRAKFAGIKTYVIGEIAN